MTYINDYTDELQLPFRFSLSQAMAARWDAMPEQVRQKYFEDFAENAESHYENTPCFDDKKPKSDVVLPGQFVLASLLAKRCGGTIPGVSKAFSHYVTVRLRRHRPVRGEVELAAFWAKAQGKRFALEVVCPVGRIDIVFEDEWLVIEAKYANEFKHAIGQALSYRECYRMTKGKHWQAGILLLGNRLDHDFRTIECICKNLEIAVFWYNE